MPDPAAIPSGSATTSQASDNKRPVTSKPRGVCLYYKTDRGCYNGDRCKFLHGQSERKTPYDINKVCKYHAAGYCKRGDECWFIHAAPNQVGSSSHHDPPAVSDEDYLCSICYDKPVKFGLLGGCSHVFCLPCIRSWRGSEDKSVDVVEAGTNKTCPMCRTTSRFVTPSSIFSPDGDPMKVKITEQYKDSMARVHCRYFQKSRQDRRFCPYGDECFYKHETEDGMPYIFGFGADYMMERARRSRWGRDDIEFTDFHANGIFDVVLSSISRALRGAHVDSLDMERTVLSSLAAVLGTQNQSPRFHLSDVPVEVLMGFIPSPEAGPLSDPELSSHPIVDWPSDQVAPSEDGNESRELALAPSTYFPWANSPRLSMVSTSDTTTSEFVPTYLDGLRPLPPGPPPLVEPDTPSPDQHSVEQTEQNRALTPFTPSDPYHSPQEPVFDIFESIIREEVSTQDTDPLFMTDGRGRVVGSNALSSRGREGGRGRATSSPATILPHIKNNLDVTLEEHPGEASQPDLQRPFSLTRRISRQRSLPLVSPSADEARSTDFVTDGRGRVVFAPTNIS